MLYNCTLIKIIIDWPVHTTRTYPSTPPVRTGVDGTPVHDPYNLIILDFSMTLPNKNGLFIHKNANMQATVITEPDKFSQFTTPFR